MKTSILIWFLFFFTTYSFSQMGEYEELVDFEVVKGESYQGIDSRGKQWFFEQDGKVNSVRYKDNTLFLKSCKIEDLDDVELGSVNNWNEDIVVLDFIQFQNEIYMVFYTYKGVVGVEVRASKVDFDNMELAESSLLFKESVHKPQKSKPNSELKTYLLFKDFEIIQSPNDSILTFKYRLGTDSDWNPYYKVYESYLSVQVFDEDLNFLFLSQVKTLSSDLKKDKLYYNDKFIEVVVDDNGVVYVLEFIEDELSNKSAPLYHPVLTRMKGGRDIKTSNIKTNGEVGLNNMHLFPNHEGVIIGASYLESNSNYNVFPYNGNCKGVLFNVYSKDLLILNEFVCAIPESLKANYSLKNTDKLKKKNQPNTLGLDIKNIFTQSDNYYVCFESHVRSQNEYLERRNDFFIFSVASQGELNWARRIVKKQTSSIECLKLENTDKNIELFFFDNNLNQGKALLSEPLLSTPYTTNNLLLNYTISKESGGVLKNNLLFKVKDHGLNQNHLDKIVQLKNGNVFIELNLKALEKVSMVILKGF